MALREEGVSKLPDQRVCQVLTNLGSAMPQVGRPVEAVEYWDRALEVVPLFSMARGNRGYGLSYLSPSPCRGISGSLHTYIELTS
jgi:hypothetical protein